ncbi:MAG TPA: zinc-dependent metalloprotease [Chryseolinea sp.]|nr:zinc-dependent metalloprotease [Chryseolinea sp.]
MMRHILWLLFLLTTVLSVQAQKKDTLKIPFPVVPIAVEPLIAPIDTSILETPSSVPAGNMQLSAPSTYNKLIKPGAITRNGIFTVHKVGDKYYFEIPDTLLERDILIVTRIAQGAAGVRPGYSGYSGDQVGNTIIRFEKGPDHKLFLRRITFEEQPGDSTNSMYNSVVRSNLQPLVAAFGIGAYSPNGTGSVIDVTDYVNGDNDILFFNTSTRKSMQVGSLQPNMSYIKDISAFPVNLELRTIKTYVQTSSDETFTIELNTSLVLLPKIPMRKRFSDRRVGYFTERYTSYDANPQGVKVVNYIKRWRLEPKPEDVARYKAGELVEPQKPIVYYIDPTTPKKWVPYLMQGVMDWQVAFEKAGFKNAIIAKEAPSPTANPNWSLQDARHSAIVYKPSSIANAAGPIITDPRSGEILESHINWYHNLMSTLHDWYMIQCGMSDPKARKMKFDDALMGELIRSVCAHEVGHSLGLTHNFGSSSSVPVEKLRDKKWVEEHGHTPSIMDYSRFNYVAQPEDSISQKGLISRIGDYDLWAIQYGYRLLPEITQADSEIPFLNGWIMEKAKDRRNWFGSEFSSEDPRIQTEDLGDNAMKAGDYGIKNLQRIVPRLIQWTYEPNEGYKNLRQVYSGLIAQYQYYLGHVATNIAGTYETTKSAEQIGPVFSAVPANLQRDALNFLGRNVFQTPTWLLDTAVLARTGQSPEQIVNDAQHMVINVILSNSKLTRLSEAEAMYGLKAYHLVEYMDDLDNLMWTELAEHSTVTIYRRNLQRYYVERLMELANTKSGWDNRDVGPLTRNKLLEIRARIEKALPKTKDAMTVYHLRYILDKLPPASKFPD